MSSTLLSAPTVSTELIDTPAATTASGYDFVQCARGQDTIVARLQVKASEVNALIRELDPRGAARDAFLFVFADTFVLDDQFFDSPMITIVARIVDVSSGVPFVLPEETELGMAGLQLLTQEIRGGQLTVMAGANPEWTVPATFNAVKAPQAISCAVEGTLFTHEVSGVAARITEVARNPQVWNVLKAQFAAACEWLDVPAKREEGAAALRWLVQCTRALAAEPSPIAAEACQLNYQAAAMLMLASGAGAARYVPVWSQDYLEARINQLLNVLEGYENKIQTLEIRTDVQKTVEDLSKALGDVARADEGALATAAQLNRQEIDATWKQYNELLWAYEMQTHAVRLAFQKFAWGMDQAATMQVLKSVMQIVNLAGQIAAAYFGVGVPDPKIAAKAAEAADAQAIDLAKSMKEVEKILVDGIKRDLIAQVMKMKNSLERMATMTKAAVEAGKKAMQIADTKNMEARGTIELPDMAEMGALDPELDWNIFIAKIELTLRESMNGGHGAEGSPPVEGAKEYYLSLFTLAEYGKALGLKSVALTRLQARALEIAAQRNAAAFAVERWNKLRTEAKSTAEKVSLCKSLMLEAALNTKRSLLVMAEGYRAAHAYNYLVEPQMKLTLAMDYNALNEEFKSIKRDIETFFKKAQYTQEFFAGDFEIPVFTAASTVPATQGHAILTTPADGKPVLSWTMSLDSPPFKRWLTEGSRAAYFVQEAWFYLEGAEPNADGDIRLQVATSGRYDNGYGAGEAAHFMSQGMSLAFGYEPKKGNELSVRWRPVGKSRENYMIPTPFTNWLATIEKAGSLAGLKSIRIKLALLRQELV
jgi:hypothetical protein